MDINPTLVINFTDEEEKLLISAYNLCRKTEIKLKEIIENEWKENLLIGERITDTNYFTDFVETFGIFIDEIVLYYTESFPLL
jgi:hypothetical protein